MGRGHRSVVFCAIVAALWSHSGSFSAATADEPPSIERLVRSSTLRPDLQSPEAHRTWTAALTPSALLSADRAPLAPGIVRLDLAGMDPLLLQAQQVVVRSQSSFDLVGEWIDGSPGHAVFVVRSERVYATVRRPGLNLQIHPLAGRTTGDHIVNEWDESAWPDETVDYVPVWTPPGTFSPEVPPAAAGDPLIDVLVVYTPATRLGAGGVEAIEALIALAELETNSSYANGLVDQRIRVVHSQEVPYVESGSTATDLPNLAGTTDGFIDEVHALRDLYGADAVSLWIETGGCGRGYLMTNVSAGFASSAFNVVQRSCATGNLTFGHELGHNMSLRHDWYVDQSTSPWGFNHGYVHLGADASSSFRTVMSYADRCTAAFAGDFCTRLQYFSNPDVDIAGDLTGVLDGLQNCLEGVEPIAECDADNAGALDGAAATFAAFRPTTVMARITKEVSQSSVDIGAAISYTLTVTNDSGQTADQIVVRDTVPAHTVLDASSLSADAATTGVTPGSIVTWTTSQDLAPGQSLQRTFSVTATEGGMVENRATVESSSTPLTVGSNTAFTTVWEAVSCGFTDDFESGNLSHYWKVESTNDGRARVTTELVDTGIYSAVLDDRVADSTRSTASLILAAALSGATTAQFDFRWAEAGDENGVDDGVSVRSGEGEPWFEVLPFANSTDLEFQDASINLVQVAADNGLTLTDGFQIRLQFEDNFPFNPGNLGGSDGYAIDNVSLSCACTLELSGATVSGPDPVAEQSNCTIYVGPSYTVASGADLTLRSPQSIVLRDGVSVEDGASLTIELGPTP